MRGAWIEIVEPLEVLFAELSLPVRGAWIEISIEPVTPSIMLSLPVRGAWIEMRRTWDKTISRTVAPRAGSVD